MDASLTGILGIGIMILLFMTRMPIAFVMLLVGFTGFSLLTSWGSGLSLMSRNIHDTFSSAELATIPLFILMGQIAFNSGISRRLYDTAYHFLGNIRGGLAMATVATCTAFGAVCGSSPATAATMAAVGIPEMKRYGYANSLAAASVASGGGLGMIMPPSLVLIIYGILTEQSIGHLFIAGVLPALLLTTLFVIGISLQCFFDPTLGPQGTPFTTLEKLKSLINLIDTLLIFLLVIGGIFQGWFTPTESASIGVLGILTLALIKRQLTWKKFINSLNETLRTSCMVFVLIAGAVVFGKFLMVTRIPFDIASWVTTLDMPPFAIMTVIVMIYFLGGCFMDSLALIMLTIPVFYPAVTSMGYDPIWFGIVIVLITEMGVITPPVGINVYVVYGMCQKIAPEISLDDIFKGVLPFMVSIIIGIALLFIFPQIILCLPQMMH